MEPSGVRWRALVPLLGLACLLGCHSSPTTASPTTTVSGTAATTNSVPADLRPTIFDSLPARFIEAPPGSDLDGPLGLTATANAVDDQQPAAQEMLLQKYGFVRSYERTWGVKGVGETLIIRVQVMGSPSQARAYYNVLTYADKVSSQLTTFSTPSLSGASGFTRSFAGSTGPQISQDINLVRGPLFYHLIFTGPQGSLQPSDVLDIARSQSALAASIGYS